ncbi:MAG: hypothetical protein ACREF4_01805 [Gammaproteobacteria bacterium]
MILVDTSAWIELLRDPAHLTLAIRDHATVLHNDGDFDVLARHTRLRIEPRRTLHPVR